MSIIWLPTSTENSTFYKKGVFYINQMLLVFWQQNSDNLYVFVVIHMFCLKNWTNISPKNNEISLLGDSWSCFTKVKINEIPVASGLKFGEHTSLNVLVDPENRAEQWEKYQWRVWFQQSTFLKSCFVLAEEPPNAEKHTEFHQKTSICSLGFPIIEQHISRKHEISLLGGPAIM